MNHLAPVHWQGYFCDRIGPKQVRRDWFWGNQQGSERLKVGGAKSFRPQKRADTGHRSAFTAADGDDDPDGADAVKAVWLVVYAVWVDIPHGQPWTHWETWTRDAVWEAHRARDSSSGASELVDPTLAHAQVRARALCGGGGGQHGGQGYGVRARTTHRVC